MNSSWTAKIEEIAARFCAVPRRSRSLWVRVGQAADIHGVGQRTSNLDLVLTPRGIAGGQQVLVATHCARSYADSLLALNVNRDNAVTSGMR